MRGKKCLQLNLETRTFSPKHAISSCSSIPKKNNQPSRKMGQRSKWTFVQRRHPGGHTAPKKMLSITNYWRNSNQNGNKISPHTPQNVHLLKDLQRLNVAEGEGNRESYTVGREVNGWPAAMK